MVKSDMFENNRFLTIATHVKCVAFTIAGFIIRVNSEVFTIAISLLIQTLDLVLK